MRGAVAGWALCLPGFLRAHRQQAVAKAERRSVFCKKAKVTI